MTFPTVTYVTQSAPTIDAPWLNAVNTICVTWDGVFGTATTAAQMRTALGSTATGDSLFTAASAAAARTTLGAAASGANTDITSLASPAIAAATATTQSSSDNTTKVATTAMVQSAILAATGTAGIPARQTVLSGPVDSSGYASFGGATGSTTVTASGTLTTTAAAGFGTKGPVDYIGQITNPSWTGLSTNGTMYLYLDVTSGGTVTTGSSTLAPTYQWGGTYSTTSGQHTYNIQEGTMKAGNGSVATQVYRTFVGEVTVSGGVVTAITWYQPMGRYQGSATLPANGSTVAFSHNVGMPAQHLEVDAVAVATATDSVAAAGEAISVSINNFVGALGRGFGGWFSGNNTWTFKSVVDEFVGSVGNGSSSNSNYTLRVSVRRKW